MLSYGIHFCCVQCFQLTTFPNSRKCGVIWKKHRKARKCWKRENGASVSSYSELKHETLFDTSPILLHLRIRSTYDINRTVPNMNCAFLLPVAAPSINQWVFTKIYSQHHSRKTYTSLKWSTLMSDLTGIISRD